MARRPELVAAAGLFALYLAVMSGHLLSIDGLLMWRQALSMTYHHSFSLVPTVWWGGTLNSSYRGLGASLEYMPSAVGFFWLSSHVPTQAGAQYDFDLYYKDVLYVIAGAPVWALITALTAALVGLTSRATGATSGNVLWSIAFYGLGSPALAASRGDWPQPLVALSWIVGVYACLRFRKTTKARWLWLCSGAVIYGVLTRPLEGSLLLPAVLILLSPVGLRRPAVLIGQIAAWVVAVASTVLTNWARFGSPTDFGYPASNMQWTTPLWVGLPADLISPGRGIVWEFPAIVLSVVGVAAWWRSGKRIDTVAFVGIALALLLEASLYVDWVGGWDWGFRFFQPALPLLAVLAGAGAGSLPSRTRIWVPSLLTVAGFLWNVPVIATDLLGGYGATYAFGPANWRLQAYPPIGAWAFLHHLRPMNAIDSATLDFIWFRATRQIGMVAVLPFVLLIVTAAWLWFSAIRSVQRVETDAIC